MFRFSTILRELVQSLAKVKLLLKQSAKLRHCILCGDVAACREMACVMFVVQTAVCTTNRVAACALRNEQAATLLEFIYHSRIILSVGGSVWHMIRNLRCIVTIDSVLANSKTQNAFLFTVNAIFRHDYSLAVETGNTPRPLVQKKLGEILYLLICSFLSCLSWLLRSRVRKSRRDLWKTLYIDSIMNCATIKVKNLFIRRPSLNSVIGIQLFRIAVMW